MHKRIILPSLLQKIVSEEEVQDIIELVSYRDITQKFGVQTIINFFVMAATNE